jgi:Flp pilus assembly protein CpaB
VSSAALVLILAGAALAAELSAPGAPGGAAVALRLDARKCHYAAPGDRIDVIHVRREKKTWLAETLLLDVPVLDARLLESGQAELDLGLDPKQAEAYRRALAKGGVFTVATRAPGDRELFPVPPASFERLFR